MSKRQLSITPSNINSFDFRDAKSLVMDGVWYIFGGDIGKTYKSEIEAYDPKGKNVLFCILVRTSKTYIAIITQNNLLLFCSVGDWKIVGSLPLGMSDHCMVALDDSHAVLNAGEWLLEGEAMTGDTYILDVHMHQTDVHLHFQKGKISCIGYTH